MTEASSKPVPLARDAYPYRISITTRWMDNDVYGHVNNVVYYSWVDTVVNQWLIENDLLKSEKNPFIGLVVHSECDYYSALSYPERIEVGLKLNRMGNSSVHYQVGIFLLGSQQPSAQARFVHVYVDPLHHQPQPLGEVFKSHLDKLR